MYARARYRTPIRLLAICAVALVLLAVSARLAILQPASGESPSLPPSAPPWDFPIEPLPGPPAGEPEPAPGPSEPGPSEPAAPDPAFLDLQERMAGAIAAYGVPGRYAIAVTDLQAGHTIGVNAGRSHYSGCVMNLFVILSVYRDLEAGLYAPELVDHLVAETLWSSNASTALLLYGITGGGDTVAGVAKVGALLRELGLEEMLIDHPPAFGQYSLGIDPDNWLTAEAMNRALAALYHGTALSEPWRGRLLEAMTKVKPGLNYLTAYGAGGVVSHKNGFFPYERGFVDNDAGIVRFERGGTEYAYAITFLSEDVPWKYGDIALGQQLSKMAWAYFDAAYPAGE
jgi:hypothetical protein